MNIPTKCPICNKKTYWNIRTELDWESETPDDDRIDDQIFDQIFECDECHALFRVRWQLKSFKHLIEESDNPSERGKRTK